MMQPKHFLVFLLLLSNSHVGFCEEMPSEELLLFLANYADDQGNWDAPPLEDEATSDTDQEGETND